MNYFSIDAKVRFTDPQTSNVVRDVDAFVFGDLQTPVTDSQNVLINDCRVHDRITFTVPNDLAPAIYQIQVVVPNITGISEYGAELLSNMEYINLTPPATARFQIAIEQINARKETWPEWPGSDEVGLHTWAAALGTDFTLIDLDPNNQQNKKLLERAYRHDFDSGTQDSPNLNVFQHDQEILAMFLLVWGDEIDNDDEYKKELQGTADKWYELLGTIVVVEALAVAPFVKYWPWGKFWFAVAAVALFLGDLIWALWAPADPLIRDVIALSIDDLATLTSANAPPPGPTTYTMDDIVVNVNKTIPPVKLPTLYRETREYVSDGIYELIYRYDHVA